MAASQKLIRALRKALRELADPARAPLMQAYMKSAMPYLGIPAVPFRKAVKAVLAAYPLDSFEDWRDTALALWRGARYREERYAVIELVGYRSYEKFRTLDALPLYEEMISTGAWWDYVDSIAGHRLGELLRRYPKELRAILRDWAVSDDLWKRRSAILTQLGFKGDTDLKLLYDCMRPSLERPEFFLRKAIGWALRQHAWTDSKEVVRFVKAHDKRLSPLSKREALKNIKGNPP
ncbi:MAG TPA: DNA alkylation repair protein, partial [Terracidiphilus sp.]|nr:DNA alkylation repair protein [Terracidiphilus sp.]